MTLSSDVYGSTLSSTDMSTTLTGTMTGNLTDIANACASVVGSYEFYNDNRFNVYYVTDVGWSCVWQNDFFDIFNDTMVNSTGVECSYFYSDDQQ
ncbi:hypothetical protein ANO11243_092480 [Dothideomycetidae sp. 11243]|nr:hypothetical protein ANO11243_092480 [fungal sp. No.11243]